MMKFFVKFFKKKVDELLQYEFERRKSEIEEKLMEEDIHLKNQYNERLSHLTELNTKLDYEIQETKRVREQAQEEQKRLWEKLDILRENLNAEQIWIRMWEAAFNKAFDVAWGILKDGTVHIAETAREDGYLNAKEELSVQFDKKYQTFIDQSKGSINVPLLIKRREEIKNEFLTYSRLKDSGRAEYFKAQLDFIAEIFKEDNQ